ncbi:hypothetical protein PG989_015612 [Apiospora arundinis]
MDCSAPEPPVQQEQPVSYTALTPEELQSWHRDHIIAGTGPLGPMDDVRHSVEADKLIHRRVDLRIQRLASSLSVVQGFCAQCQHLLDHWPHFESGLSDVDVFGRTVDTLEMEAASRRGCRLCTFLLWRLRAEGVLDVYRKVEGRLQALERDFTSSLFVHDPSERVYLSLPGLGRTMTTPTSWPCTQAARIDFHIMDPSANFREMKSLDMVKKWLRNCDDNHHIYCRNKKQPGPTRLIHLGSEKLRIVLTREMDQLPPYATLSYCWGLEPFTMLTRETLDAFMDEIPASELPKTFRDAIHIARELGISYIWIDALCIIQGNTNDWEQEAGRMRYVYGGSYLNIAATFATSAHGGCFDEPKHHYNNGVIVRVTTNDHSRIQAFHSPADHGITTTRSALATRAWAFQERILSPRTLYCGSLGLFWECDSEQGSEFLPVEFPFKMDCEFTCPSKADGDWDELVEQYSGTILTHSSDRLPALSGIAMRECEARDDQYLAGMWRKRLAHSLLWRRAWWSKRQRTPGQAPTWSWESIEGKIQVLAWSFDDACRSARIRVLDAWTTPSGPDPYGPVSAGMLTLACACLLRGQLDGSADIVHLEVLDEPESGLVRNSTIEIPVYIDCVDEGEIQGSRSVYLLPFYTRDESSIGYLEHYGVLGLVLQCCAGGEKGHFRRIGALVTRSPYRDERPVEKELEELLLRLIARVGPQTAETECNRVVAEPEYQDSPYVITIE